MEHTAERYPMQTNTRIKSRHRRQIDKKLKRGAAEKTTERRKETLSDTKSYLLRRKIVSVLSLLVMLAFFAVITMTIGKQLLALMASPDAFRAWVDNHGFLGRIAFIGMMALQVVVAVIPGEPMEIGAGYAFGAWEGLLLCLIGAAAGSAVVFLFTKLFGVKMVEAFISREKLQSMKFMQNSKKLSLLTFILFFIPGTPKDVITYFIGLTPMRLSTFLLLSTVARVPSVVTSTLGGDALGLQNYTFAIVVFAITALLSGAGLLIYRHISKQKSG